MAAEINILLLSGGQSSRMQLDKALLEYYQKPQVLYLCEQLASLNLPVYLSVRKDQFAEWPQSLQVHLKEFALQITILFDEPEFGNSGPMSGLLTAMNHRKDNAWLICGCDYPLLTLTHYKKLLSERNPLFPGTAFSDPVDGKPLPMPAIVEAKTFSNLLRDYHSGNCSLRRLFIQEGYHSLRIEERDLFLSADTPEAYQAIKTRLEGKQ